MIVALWILEHTIPAMFWFLAPFGYALTTAAYQDLN